jgi:uncharacterized FlaG/YvyC family protein
MPAPATSAAQAAASPKQELSIPKAKIMEIKPVQLQFDEVKAKKNLDEAIKSLNDQMASNKTGLGFSMDKSLQRPVVIVQNTATGEVVRKIPTEVVIRMAHSIDEMKGLLLNKSV